MSNTWTGMTAKSICARKRTRTFWNIFFCIIIAVILLALSLFAFQIASENVKYHTEQIFIEYEGGFLGTDSERFKIPNEERQEIGIQRLIRRVQRGDGITLTVSRLSGTLLEVEYAGDLVYKREPTPVLPTALACVILVIPMLGFCIFMLIITNIKNPGKRIEKMQDKFLLKFYR